MTTWEIFGHYSGTTLAIFGRYLRVGNYLETTNGRPRYYLGMVTTWGPLGHYLDAARQYLGTAWEIIGYYFCTLGLLGDFLLTNGVTYLPLPCGLHMTIFIAICVWSFTIGTVVFAIQLHSRPISWYLFVVIALFALAMNYSFSWWESGLAY